MAIRLHVEDERAIPLSVSGGDNVELKHSEAFINAISPTARVDQTEDGAVVTITDKNGTTTAEISNGPAGPQGPKGDPGNTAQSDWTETDNTSASYIANKPNIIKGTGVGSIIEGDGANVASKIYSHAEGMQTISSGTVSHAEGLMTKASGTVSHAEGSVTVASGDISHAEGLNTIASSKWQHVEGKYNIKDTENKYAHIVGNGTDDDVSKRSNAHTLDWNGNAWFAGKVSAEGTPTASGDLINKGFFEGALNSVKSAMFFGQCDPTSTATEFTAQIDGITEYFDGLTILLKNGVVNSATNCTFNINGLGAKGAWGTFTAARISTEFSTIRIYMFIYDSTLDEGNGGWWIYQGKDVNDNSVGYLIRTTYSSLPVSSITYRYRLLFTSADKTHYVPANNSSATNATAKRDVCQEKIDPFGKIVFYNTSNVLNTGDRPGLSYQMSQYYLNLGYSFNRTGTALALNPWEPVYIKATPYADGSAIIDADEPITQDLPTTEDGKIYIHLGIMYGGATMELSLNHPIYYYHNGAVLPWFGPLYS